MGIALCRSGLGLSGSAEAVSADFKKPVRVTISDPETGEELESRVVTNDYVLITVGNRYLKNAQRMGTTHVLAVAVEKPLPYVATDYAASTKAAS
jgi:hypothetical protein